jgi:hypothetical protein
MALQRPILVVLALAAGCAAESTSGVPGHGSDELQITEPAAGAVLSRMLAHVVGTTTLDDASAVTVNGQTFAVAGGRFEGDVELGEGPSRISATLSGYEAWVDVIVDTLPPAVVIESPEPGSFVDGEAVFVHGRVTDATLASLRAGDMEIPVAEDGTFGADIRTGTGAHRIRLTATDRAGHEGTAFTTALVGRFERAEHLRPEAVIVELGGEALVALGEGVTPYLRSETLEPLILEQNPVTTGFWGELDVVSETHGEPGFMLTPREGRMDVLITIPSVRMPLSADLSIGPTLTGLLTADRAELRATAAISAEGGRPVVSLSSVEVTLIGLLIDVDGLWSWIDENVVTRAARGLLEAQLVAMIEEQVPMRLEEALSGLDELRSVEVADGAATVRTELAELSVAPTGLRAALDMSFEAIAPVEAYAARAPGVLVENDMAPQRSNYPGVYAAVSNDLLNSAVHATWLRGALSQTFEPWVYPSTGEPVTLGELAVFIPSLLRIAPADTRLALELETVLPPVASEPSSGLLGADAPDVRARVFAITEDQRIALFTLSASAHAEIQATLTDGAVSITFARFDLTGDVMEGPPDTPRGADLDELLASLVAQKVLELVRIDGIPLPSFAGFEIESPEAYSREGYLRFEGDLVLAPHTFE